MSATAASETDEEPETYEYVTVLEYNETAAEYGKEPGDRIVASGHRRNQHIRDEDREDFVRIADGVAAIELHEPLTNDEVTDWCNSGAGKLALAHYFDHTDAVKEAAL